MKTLNKRVALEPIVIDDKKTNSIKGVDVSDLMVSKLVPTKVVYDSENFIAGGIAYIDSTSVKTSFNNKKFELDGKTFVLFPEEFVVIYKNPSVV